MHLPYGMAFLVVVIVASCLACPALGTTEPVVVSLWPGKAAGDTGTFGPEHFRTEADSPTKDAKWLTDVTKPTISVFRAPKDKNTGVAMIVCPGGGYWNLAWDLEGEEVATWLNSVGITGIVLKYRVPRRPGEPEALPAPGPLLDAQRAVSLVRNHAKEWDIDPDRIGMVGFSAGGHLVIATATNFDKRGYEPIDDVDKVSCRPDFVVAVYPGYLAVKETGAIEPYIRIPEHTPPVMLVHARGDTISSSENSVAMYVALKRAGVSAELHIYAVGEHGFGVRGITEPGKLWPGACVEWLKCLGILKEVKTH